MLSTLILASNTPNLSLDKGAVWLKGFLLLLVTVLLVYLTMRALLTNGRQGDVSGSASMVGATVICLIPLGLAGGVAVATGYGDALLDLVVAIFS